MTRYMHAATAALILAGGLGSAGCQHGTGATSGATCGDHYRNAVDTTWPDNYNYAARQATIAPFAQQAANGHFAEQTVWNWYFEPGTDRLNGAGMAKLDTLAQSTPVPDNRIFLQAARDVPATPDNLDKVKGLREELSAKRAAVVQKYMSAQPGQAIAYDIAIHDAPTPGIYSTFASDAFLTQRQGYMGGLGITNQFGQMVTPGVNSGVTLQQGGGAAAGVGPAMPVPVAQPIR